MSTAKRSGTSLSYFEIGAESADPLVLIGGAGKVYAFWAAEEDGARVPRTTTGELVEVGREGPAIRRP